jgi:hypothetical protein
MSFTLTYSDIPIYSELVSDKFTVDNLGEVSSIVKSDVLPLTMINWSCAAHRFLASDVEELTAGHSCLCDYAVHKDDLDLLKFLIALGAEQQALLAIDEDDTKCYSIDRNVFYSAVKLGRTTILAEMIKVGSCLQYMEHIVDVFFSRLA